MENSLGNTSLNCFGSTKKSEDIETEVHVGTVLNIGGNCVIEGDVKTSTNFDLKLYFKDSRNLYFLLISTYPVNMVL